MIDGQNYIKRRTCSRHTNYMIIHPRAHTSIHTVTYTVRTHLHYTPSPPLPHTITTAYSVLHLQRQSSFLPAKLHYGVLEINNAGEVGLKKSFVTINDNFLLVTSVITIIYFICKYILLFVLIIDLIVYPFCQPAGRLFSIGYISKTYVMTTK